jgi:hypothetical protein
VLKVFLLNIVNSLIYYKICNIFGYMVESG